MDVSRLLVCHNDLHRRLGTIKYVTSEEQDRASPGSSDETCPSSRCFSVDRWSYSYGNRRTTTPIYCHRVSLRFRSIPTTWRASAVRHFCLRTPWTFSNNSMVPCPVPHAIRAIRYHQTIQLETRRYRSRILSYWKKRMYINHVYL